MNEQLDAIKAQAEGGHLDVMVIAKADVLAIFAEVERLTTEVASVKEGATNERLAAIRARRAAITPPPWYAERVKFKDTYAVAIENKETRLVTFYPPSANRDTDAAFIAAAPADVDTLLAMVERLTARAEEAEALLAGSPADTLAWALDKREQELREARREVDRLTGELVAERDAAKRHAAYIASCVDECGSYRP